MKKISYYISLTALFLIPFFPLIPMPFWPFNFTDSFFFPFITGKAFYFRILVEIAFAGWIVLAFTDAKYRPKLNSLTIAVTLFALITFIADLLGVSPLRSFWSNFERMEGWITIIHLWAFFMVSTHIFGSGEVGKRLWHRWLNTSIFVALVAAIYGLLQLFGLAAIHQGSVRLDASLGNAAYMAVYMMIHVFIALYMFFVMRGKILITSNIKNYDQFWPKFRVWIYVIIAVLFSFIVFETQTRGTALGLIGGIMLALFLYAVLGKNQSSKSRLFVTGALVFMILLGIIFWFNRSSSFVQNSPVLQRLATISLSEVKTQARQYIWPMAISGAMERPLFGWGQENFNYIFNADYNPKMWSQEQWFDRAHSVFLDWLVAGGLVGLLSYLSLYIIFLFSIWKSGLTIAEKSVLTGLLAGYAIHNIFVFDNLASYVLFFAILGFGSSLREGRPIIWFGVNPSRADVVEYIVAPIVVIVIASSIYFFNVRVIIANTRLITALAVCSSGQIQPDPTLFEKALSIDSYTANQEIREQLLNCAGGVISSSQVPGPTKLAFFELANAQIDAQKTATPKDVRAYVLAGSFMTNAGQIDLAVPILEKAHELSPTKQSIDLMLASDYINLNRADEALFLLKEAYESATDNSNVKSAYVLALVLTGKESEARKLFGDDPILFESQQMGQGYASIKQYSKAINIYNTLIKANPTDINLRAQLAQIQYSAGQIETAIATMRAIEKDRPDLKDQIEEAIKQVQK